MKNTSKLYNKAVEAVRGHADLETMKLVNAVNKAREALVQWSRNIPLQGTLVQQEAIYELLRNTGSQDDEHGIVWPEEVQAVVWAAKRACLLSSADLLHKGLVMSNPNCLRLHNSEQLRDLLTVIRCLNGYTETQTWGGL
jgi:hypothetical protein